MDLAKLERLSEIEWRITTHDPMRVPGILFGDEQLIREMDDKAIATAYGVKKADIVVSLHCGSRGLGHQVATDYSKKMSVEARERGVVLADRELAGAPILAVLYQNWYNRLISE